MPFCNIGLALAQNVGLCARHHLYAALSLGRDLLQKDTEQGSCHNG